MKNADVLFVNIQDLYIGLCLMEYLIEYYKDIFNSAFLLRGEMSKK